MVSSEVGFMLHNITRWAHDCCIKLTWASRGKELRHFNMLKNMIFDRH